MDTIAFKYEFLASVDQNAWDQTAATLSGSFFQSYAYAIRAASSPNASPLFIKVWDKKHTCISLACITLFKPRIFPFSVFCRTAVIDSLPAVGCHNADLQLTVMKEITSRLKSLGVFKVSVNSFNSPDSAYVLDKLGFRLQSSARFEFYLDTEASIGTLWENLKSERRTNIRKAAKLGVQTCCKNDISSLRVLYDLQQTSLQRHAVELPVSESSIRDTKRILLDNNRASLMLAYYNNAAVSAALFGLFANCAYYLNSGSSAIGYEVRGPAQIIWEMVTQCNAKKIVELNLGGVITDSSTIPENDGLYRFKRDFGARPVFQPRGHKIISPFGAGLDILYRKIRRILANK